MRSVALVLVIAGCTEGASADRGLAALLQVKGAQFRPGAFPSDAGGPAALQLLPHDPTLVIGTARATAKGYLARDARSAILGIAGEDGAWILPAGPPPPEAPEDTGMSAVFGVAVDFPPGPLTLVLAAGDAAGRIGPATTADVVALPDEPPTGKLVVTLAWRGPADLDLHVVDPTGGEAWTDDPNTWVPPPPGEPVDPDAWKTGGVLDHDGNARCALDGPAPEESVIWATRTSSTGQPIEPIIPSGDYIARVDTRSLCGAPAAVWTVAAYRDGALLGAATGTSTPADAQHPEHGAGTGVTALHFTLP